MENLSALDADKFRRADSCQKNSLTKISIFTARYLQGTKEQQPRWKRCVTATDGDLGEALGQEFVKKAFTPEAKARMDELITNLFAAMKERLNGLDWMTDETKIQAQKKLSTFKRKIGYPDVLRGYKGLTISRNSLSGKFFELECLSGQT